MSLACGGHCVWASCLGTFRFVKAKIKNPKDERNFESYREDLGRSLLLSLEFLVAADIIRSVAITPPLESVTILGIIILIRTFLSVTMELEVSGRWPWQKCDHKTDLHNTGTIRPAILRTDFHWKGF